MKKLLVVVLLATVACSKNKSTDPADFLNEFERKGLMLEIVHYAAKLAPRASHETKFDPEFDDYYSSQAADYKWLEMAPRKEGGYYFLISRPARSITPMIEGIGGYFRIDKDSLVEYNEVFRTWKLPEDVFEPRGQMLFDRMVAGKDLSIYYPQFTGDQYIEFPDNRFVFDKEKRVWVDMAIKE